MSEITYKMRYTKIMLDNGAPDQAIPDAILELMNAFTKAHSAWEKTTADKKKKLLPVLVKADAVLCAMLTQFYESDNSTLSDEEQLRLLEIEALAFDISIDDETE